MKKAKIGMLLLAAMMILKVPLQAAAGNLPGGQVPSGKNEAEAQPEQCEGYCAYAIDNKLYAFIGLEENQDPDSFFCDIASEDITNKNFQYLKNVTQTNGNVHYIFMIDNSATMKRYQKEISAYFQSISQNEDMKAFYTLATFGERFDVVKEKMTDANTLLHELDQVSFGEKYTDPYTAVKSADIYLDTYLRGSEDLVCLVLITDGQSDLKDGEQEEALSEEASQIIASSTDVIYSTFCTKSWSETAGKSLTTGKGLQECVSDSEEASQAGERLAELLDSLYCVCFELDQAPGTDFSFELVMRFGKDLEGNQIEMANVVFDLVHNIKMLNLDALQPSDTEQGNPFGEPEEPGSGEVPSIGDGIPIEGGLPIEGDLPVGDGPEGSGEPADAPEDMDDAEDPGSQVDLKTDASAGNGNLLLIICIVCAVVAVAAVVVAVVVVRGKSSKSGKGASRKGTASTKSGGGIPLKLEVYAGRCRNKTPFLELADVLTIGSAPDCDIIFDNPEVAAKNSCIKLVNGQVYIEDLGSPQGTALDGMRFRGQNRLRGGEVISIGTVEFGILFADGAEAGE